MAKTALKKGKGRAQVFLAVFSCFSLILRSVKGRHEYKEVQPLMSSGKGGTSVNTDPAMIGLPLQGGADAYLTRYPRRVATAT